MRAGELPDRLERRADVDPAVLGDDALGLLDHGPGVQRQLELLREQGGPGDRPLLHDADRRGISQRLGHLGVEPLRLGAVVLKRFRAPMVSSRTRIGRACTAE